MSTQSKSKAEQFMESPLVAWAETFDDYDTVHTCEDLADGILLHKIMQTVDSGAYSMAKVNRSVARDPGLRLQNLQLLITRIRHFYLTTLQQLIITSLPNISVISHSPDLEYSLEEMEKLLVLLLGCVVQCEGKVPLIERMKTMDLTQQQALVVHIQTITDTTDYVCSIDWIDLEEISKPNLEGLCRTAYIHLQRVAKERDHHYETLCEVILERDYYKGLQSENANESLPHENGLPLGNTPIKSPAINAEMLEIKRKCRQLQEQLDRKTELLTDLREEVEQSRNTVHRLQHEKRDLVEEARSARVYKDEAEALKLQAVKVEKLEADVMKYRQKAEDTEYLKKRIADLKQQNELMLETKSLLEQKAASLTSRADSVDELQAEIASMRVQIDSLNQEKEMDLERIEELLAQNAQMELDARHYQEQIAQLTVDLESERERSASEISSVGEASNLSFEMTEADMASKAKVLRLEKEAREFEKSMEALRHSQAKVSELEKTNKKLYAQTHADRKEIIKLREEVEVLRVKASRVDKLQVELNGQRERLEEASRMTSKIKDLKSRNEVILEAKARLEDELENVQSKASLVEVIRDENAALKVQVESLSAEHSEEQTRTEALLEQNAQLELEKQRCTEENLALQTQLAHLRTSSGPQLPVTVLSPPKITEAEMASRAKLQRLEKETREMEKSMEAFRHSQAKMAELEKTNKKLQEQTHVDRKENVKLKEELQALKAKISRMEKLETEMRSQEQQLEDVDAARKKIMELKQQNALLSEARVLLQEEVSSFQNKMEKLNDLQAENAALKVRVDAMDQEVKEESLRMQELLQQNAQLELDRDKRNLEIESLNSMIAQLKLKPPPVEEGTISPVHRPMSEADVASQTKLLRLERDNRELERTLQVLKQSNERAAAERENTNKKLTSQIHSLKKEIAKLKEELRRSHTALGRGHAGVSRLRSIEESEIDQKQAKQFQELESKFSEAYSKSLTTKDERIQVLEKRVEEMTADNSLLREETVTLRRQSERLAQQAAQANKKSPSGSPSLGMSRTYSPREMNRLKEQAAESLRLRDKLHKIQEESHNLTSDLMDAKHVIQRQDSNNQRLMDRNQMLEQLNYTLEEEKRTLLMQVNRLLEQNQSLLMRTLDSKDQALEEERVFNDRLGELERDKMRLSEQLAAQQREHLAREIDFFKKGKSKNLLKRGFKKLKGKIQGRSHTFEHAEGGMIGHTSSAGSLNSAGALQSPSHMSGLPPYSLHDGSMSSNQSISSSNSGRPSEGGPEEYDQLDPAGASSLIPRAPTLDPFVRPRRGRSYTLPAGAKIRHPTHASSPGFEPERTDELMSLEDFLAESDKTPNRRRVMELKRASLVLNTPPVTPRNSMLLNPTSSGSGGNMFDLQEFLSKLESEGTPRPIPEVEETELEQHLQSMPASEFQDRQPPQASETGSSGGADAGADVGGTDAGNVPEVNVEGNSNSSNNNNNEQAFLTLIPREPTTSGLLGSDRGYPRSSVGDASVPASSTPNSTEGGTTSTTTISWGNTSVISLPSTGGKSAAKQDLRAVQSLGPTDYSSATRSDGYESWTLPRSSSSDGLKKGKEKKSKLSKKAVFRSSEDLLDDGGQTLDMSDKVAREKPSRFSFRRKVHKSSADLVNPNQKSELVAKKRVSSTSSASGSSRLSGLTDLRKGGEGRIDGKKPRNPNRLSLPSWSSNGPLAADLGHPGESQESLHSPKSDEDSIWFEYGRV